MAPFCYRLKLYLKPYLLSGSSCIVQDLQYATPQEMLDKIAERKNDNEIAKEVQDRRYKLFNKILPAYSS